MRECSGDKLVGSGGEPASRLSVSSDLSQRFPFGSLASLGKDDPAEERIVTKQECELGKNGELKGGKGPTASGAKANEVDPRDSHGQRRAVLQPP